MVTFSEESDDSDSPKSVLSKLNSGSDNSNSTKRIIIENLVKYGILVALAIICIIGLNYYLKSIFGTSPLGAVTDVLKGVNTAGKTLAGAVPRPSKPLGCDSTETNRAGLCYKNCATGEESDGTQRCYTNPPAGWPGGKTITHLQHKTIYSSVGADASKSVPKGCTGGKVLHGGLCYTVPSGWKVTAPGFIGQKCETIQPGFNRDDGTGCWIDAETIGRGAGYPWKWGDPAFNYDKARERCEGDWGGGNCEQYGLIYYPKCQNVAQRQGKSGSFVPSGCCTCIRNASVKYRQVKSAIGALQDGCPSDRELRGRLCYPKCTTVAGWPYERTAGNIEYCTSKCPTNWKNIGIGGCERPFRDIGTGKVIHACPAGFEKQGAICYQNCNDIAGVKQKQAERPGLQFKGVLDFCYPTDTDIQAKK